MLQIERHFCHPLQKCGSTDALATNVRAIMHVALSYIGVWDAVEVIIDIKP